MADLVAGEELVLIFFIERHAGDDPVLPAGEQAQHGARLLPVARLAQDAAGDGYHGVRADDQRFGAGIGRGARLENSRVHGEKDGIVISDRGFVHVRGANLELRRDAGHELPASGRARSQNDVHYPYKQPPPLF